MDNLANVGGQITLFKFLDTWYEGGVHEPWVGCIENGPVLTKTRSENTILAKCRLCLLYF